MLKIVKNYTASFEVDPQKGFTPVCPKELPVEGGNEIAEELNAQALFAKLRVFSKDAHPAKGLWTADSDNPQFSAVGEPNVDIRWNSHCVVGTKGFELIDGLPPVSEYDFAVYKGQEPDSHPYGACYQDLGDTKSTGVIEWLKCNDIDTVIIGGLSTDYCVKKTVEQLIAARFAVVINKAACKGIFPPGALTEEEVYEEFRNLGVVLVDNAKDLETLTLC
jgi:nicotinamidase/pyrazinamidase